MGSETELLLHHGDAELMRLLWRQRSDRAAIDQDLSAVGSKRARQEVDQRALARSIFAEQGVDAARDELDRDLAKDRIAEKSLRDAPRFKDRLVHAHFAALMYSEATSSGSSQSARRTASYRRASRCSRPLRSPWLGRGSCRDWPRR